MYILHRTFGTSVKRKDGKRIRLYIFNSFYIFSASFINGIRESNRGRIEETKGKER